MTTAGTQSFMLGDPLVAKSHTIELTNPSTRGVSWQATVVDGAAWLTVTPVYGTALYSTPSLLTLKVELGELAPAIYSGLIRVEPLDPPGLASFDVPVQLRVVESVRQIYLPSAFTAP